MQPIENKETPTYVLFGSNAIELYKISIEELLKQRSIRFHIGKYSDLNEFFKERQRWDDCIEIPFQDFVKLDLYKNAQDQKSKKKKRFNFFKN